MNFLLNLRYVHNDETITIVTKDFKVTVLKLCTHTRGLPTVSKNTLPKKTTTNRNKNKTYH